MTDIHRTIIGFIIDFYKFTGKEKEWRGPYYFVQAADIQFGLIERYLEKLPNPGWSKEIKLAEIAVDKINKLSPKPRFVAMCGDLCDEMPGTLTNSYFLAYYNIGNFNSNIRLCNQMFRTIADDCV